MALENKLGITNSAELAREEERISKKKAVELFESGALDKLAPGRFASLQAIHKALFENIYDFAGTAHGESGKGQFPLCAADVSGGGAGQHRQDAAVHL